MPSRVSGKPLRGKQVALRRQVLFVAMCRGSGHDGSTGLDLQPVEGAVVDADDVLSPRGGEEVGIEKA